MENMDKVGTEIGKVSSENIKSIRVENLGDYTYREYSNGLKICYKKSNQTKLSYTFSGGAKTQKISGLAHFVEHLMFIDDVLKKEFSEFTGATAYEHMYFECEVEHKNLIRLKDLQEYSNEKKKIKNAISRSIELLFYELNSKGWKDTDSNYKFNEERFEIEKSVIDEEYTRDMDITKYDRHGLKASISSYLGQTDIEKRCGNSKTLKNVTIDDVIEYKEQNFLVENFLLFVETPLEYEEIEDLLVQNISKKIKSNPKYKNEFNKKYVDMNKNAYYIDKVKSDLFYSQAYLIFNDKINFNTAFLLELFMRCVGINKIIYNSARKGQGLLYNNIQTHFVNENGFKAMELDASMSKENLSKYHILLANNLRVLLDKNMQMENFYKFKEYLEDIGVHTNEDEIMDMAFNNAPNYYRLMENALQSLKNMTLKDFGDMLDTLKENIHFSIALLGDIQASDLPSIDMLADIIKGKNVDRKNYPQDMSQDKDKHSKIISLDTRMTKALVPVQEREM